jgi:CubicO group peptidase (beta-lactamase class C family)
MIGGAAALLLAAAAGCGDSGSTASDAAAPDTVTSVTAAAETERPSPAVTFAATEPPTTIAETSTTAPPTTEAMSAVGDDELAAQVEALLAEAIGSESIRWDANGVDVPPTAAVAAIRIPGREDVLVAVGENVDGSPAAAGAPFSVGPLTESLVRAVGFQLVDEGLLDPTLTVDQWAPTLPNADRVTVQMLLDNETGWSDYGPIDPDPVTTDFARAWTLREAVELRATVMTALDQPGTRTNAGLADETVLALVVEDVGGRPLAELVRDRIAAPAGLDHTALVDGHTTPERYRHGVFAFNGTATDSSGFGAVSYLTWNQATHSVVSTPADLLDLLDVWVSGELFTTDRTPAPDRWAPDPAGNPTTYVGLGVPFNGYCPCIEVDGGIEPIAIGRTPRSLGTQTIIWRYADGISVVLNVNSNELANPADIDAVVRELHDLATGAR